MNKINLAITALAIAALSGCSVTNVDKNSLKEPNGNIKVNELAIQGVVPVNYTYNTTDLECSEVEFLKSTTGRKINGIRVDNIYEIHWNHVENHTKVFGISSPKQYSCNFWGLGIQYNANGTTTQQKAAPVATPVYRQTAPAPQPAAVPVQPAPQPQPTPITFQPSVAPAQQQPAYQPSPTSVTADESWD